MEGVLSSKTVEGTMNFAKGSKGSVIKKKVWETLAFHCLFYLIDAKWLLYLNKSAFYKF